MAIRFERRKLYEEVWAEPMIRLAKKYGLSDNGLRKICKAMNIPTPNLGYWAKVAAGQLIARPPLPLEAQRTAVVSHPPAESTTDQLPEDSEWLAQRQAIDIDPRNTIEFDARPRRWHPVAATWRDDLRERAQKAEAARRAAEREAGWSARRRAQASSSDAWIWRTMVRGGQRFPDTHHSVPFRVSLATYKRALAIVNALAWAAEARGFELVDDEVSGRILIRGHDAEVRLRIVERLREEWREEKRYDDREERVAYRVPTGQLQLFLEPDAFSSVSVSDAASGAIEAKLSAVFLKIYQVALRYRQKQRELNAWHRKWEEEERCRKEAEERRREEARRLEEKRKQREALIAEATEWQQARAIRDYVAHIVAAAEGTAMNVNDVLTRWASWALTVAENTDPTCRRVEGSPG